MGSRLTLSLMERSEWERCLEYQGTSDKELDVKTVEDLASDFCTDAFIDNYNNGNVKRLTLNKLDVERDVFMGVMDKDNFLDFIKCILEYTKRFPFDAERASYATKRAKDCDDKYLFFFDSSWHGAYYSAVNMWKGIDWNKYVVYCEVG